MSSHRREQQQLGEGPMELTLNTDGTTTVTLDHDELTEISAALDESVVQRGDFRDPALVAVQKAFDTAYNLSNNQRIEEEEEQEEEEWEEEDDDDEDEEDDDDEDEEEVEEDEAEEE